MSNDRFKLNDRIKSMQELLHKYIFPVSLILSLFAAVLFTTQVLAVGKPEEANQNAFQNKQLRQGSESFKQDTENESEESSASGGFEHGKSALHKPLFAQVHLQDVKLKVCQNMSENVTRRSTHLVALVAKMEQTFTSIADGVEQYYLTKVVPTGTTLPSYDALVADIATKKAVVDAMVQTTQTDAANFSCTGNNPAAQLILYRTDMQAVLKGLQDYRTAIKNLIVAVRTLKSVKVSTTPGQVTPTPTPNSPTPTSTPVPPTPTSTPTPTP